MIRVWKKIVKKIIVWGYLFFARFPRLFTLLVAIVKRALPVNIREKLKRIIRSGVGKETHVGDASGVVSVSSVAFIEETDLLFEILKRLETKSRENSH